MMGAVMNDAKNWFDQDGPSYKAFRPQYPDVLADYLAGLVRAPASVLDIGCGSGQLTQMLVGRFHDVTGIDPSNEQISNAENRSGVKYLVGTAEKIDLPNQSVDVICAAQAVHWFDRKQFYDEVKRIAKPGGFIALISYGLLGLEPDLNKRFQQFYHDEIGPFWPPERKLVDRGYADIDFPFEEIAAPEIDIKLNWDLPAFLGYLSTWSAVRHAKAQGAEALLIAYADDLAKAWGDAEKKRPVVWPVNMRVGML